MGTHVEYDLMADIYDVWVASAPVTSQHVPFYADAYVEAAGDGPVIELGVGNGRIMIEAARRGVDVIGVDSSQKMIELARRRAEEAGVADRISFILADFREFQLNDPAALITIPFHTIGHLITVDDKRLAFTHIKTQLAQGGRLILDHFIFNEAYARAKDGVPSLRAEFTHPASGLEAVLWVATRFHFTDRTMRVVAWTDELDCDAELVKRTYQRMSFSWIDPDDTRQLLESSGFEVESSWGSFDRTALSDDSQHQIWVARRT